MTNKRTKRITSALILVVIAISLFIFPASADINVEYDFRVEDGYIYVTLDNWARYRLLLSSNFTTFTTVDAPSPWHWYLTNNSGIYQSNATWWMLFPYTGTYVSSREIGYNGIELNDLPENVSVKVTYQIGGLGSLLIDNFMPIEIYDVQPGENLTPTYLKSIVSGQTLSSPRFIKRNVFYNYDDVEDITTITYETNTNSFNRLNDMFFIKHNASIEYTEDLTFFIIPSLEIKLSYSDAQKIINATNLTSSILSDIKDILLYHDEEVDELQEYLDDLYVDFMDIVEDIDPPQINFVNPEYAFVNVDKNGFDGNFFMNFLIRCPGYFTLLALGTGLWIVKVLVFGKR